MDVNTAFASPTLLLTILIGLAGGLVGVLRAESVREFAARHNPDMAARFSDADAHRRFIRFCGWALLALATGLSLATWVTAR